MSPDAPQGVVVFFYHDKRRNACTHQCSSSLGRNGFPLPNVGHKITAFPMLRKQKALQSYTRLCVHHVFNHRFQVIHAALFFWRRTWCCGGGEEGGGEGEGGGGRGISTRSNGILGTPFPPNFSDTEHRTRELTRRPSFKSVSRLFYTRCSKRVQPRIN